MGDMADDWLMAEAEARCGGGDIFSAYDRLLHDQIAEADAKGMSYYTDEDGTIMPLGMPVKRPKRMHPRVWREISQDYEEGKLETAVARVRGWCKAYKNKSPLFYVPGTFVAAPPSGTGSKLMAKIIKDRAKKNKGKKS